MVEAAANLVFVLVMNSIRQLYFEHAGVFGAVVDDHGGLAPLYCGAARAVADGDPEAAADAVRRLAEAQEARVAAAVRRAGA